MTEEVKAIDIADRMDADFKGRKSFVKLLQETRSPKVLTDHAHAVEKLRETLEKVSDFTEGKTDYKDSTIVRQLTENWNTKLGELRKCATEEGGRFILNGTTVDEIDEFRKAKGAFDAAESELLEFLGGKPYKGEGMEKAVSASPKLQKAYKDASKATKGINTLLNGWFSDLKIWGPESTLKHHLGLGEEIAEGAKTKIGFRWGGVAVGAAMAGDAIVRGQKADGDKRSMYERMAELAAGVGIAGASAFAGAAR